MHPNPYLHSAPFVGYNHQVPNNFNLAFSSTGTLNGAAEDYKMFLTFPVTEPFNLAFGLLCTGKRNVGIPGYDTFWKLNINVQCT